MAKKKKRQESRVSTFLKQDNWYVSAGLVMLIYPVIWYYLSTDWTQFNTEGPSAFALFLRNVIHVMPALALVMVVLGYFDKKKKDELDAERKKAKYQATLTMDRAQREKAAFEKATAAPKKRQADGAKPAARKDEKK